MISLAELAAALNLEVGPPAANVSIVGVSSIASALPGTIVFATDIASAESAIRSAASGIILPADLFQELRVEKPVLLSANPRLDFARAADLLRASMPASGIHPTAAIDTTAEVAEGASIAAFAVIEAGAKIGAGTIIGAGAVVGVGVVIGEGCHVYPRVVIYPRTTLGDRVIVHAGAVLGGDGFGYVRDPGTGQYLQFPQQGRLILEDDVEVGANTTIDRGALDETRIGRGTKIDNLVHLGHNVQVGRHTVIAAQTGISGSSTVGDNVMLGGQVGIGDHAHVGDGVILGGQGGILPGKTLSGPGTVFWGTPAKPVREFLKELATLTRLTRSRRKEHS